MTTGDRFYSYMRNLRKKRGTIGEEQAYADVERSFHTCMAEFPEPLRHDLYHHFFDAYASGDRGETALFGVADKLQRIVDLFAMEYESKRDDLSDDDWIAVREAVDDNAHELDTKLMTYIMRFILGRGLI